MLTGSKDKTARLWDTPRPIPGRLVGIAAVTHIGMRMGDSGRMEPVTADEHSNAWKELETSGTEWLAQQRRLDDIRRADGIVMKRLRRKLNCDGTRRPFT